MQIDSVSGGWGAYGSPVWDGRMWEEREREREGRSKGQPGWHDDCICVLLPLEMRPLRRSQDGEGIWTAGTASTTPRGVGAV